MKLSKQMPVSFTHASPTAYTLRRSLPVALLALAVLVAPLASADDDAAEAAASQPAQEPAAQPAAAKPAAAKAKANANRQARANRSNANAAARAKRQKQAAQEAQAPQAASTEEQTPEQMLLANSPFMSKAFKERLARSDSSRARDLVFRGFAGTDNGWLINVYNNRDKRSEWVRVGESVADITISEFDMANMRLKITKDSTSIYLPLE